MPGGNTFHQFVLENFLGEAVILAYLGMQMSDYFIIHVG